ncbi:MAG: lamin tail domain-containing protein [bacterium]
MKKIVFCALILGAKGFCGYSESQFFFDRGETPRAVHYTANGFKSNATYQLKFYGKQGDSATETSYVKILSNDNQWLSVNEDGWSDDLPTFTTEDNGYKEGWVYVKNSWSAELGTYTCAFSVKEVGTGGEIMKPGTFRPLTIMDMNTEGGWLDGVVVHKNGQPAVNSHLVFLAKDGKVLGSVDSEPNRILDDNQGAQDGYFKIALPKGTVVSTITDWDGNLYELPDSTNGKKSASIDNPSTGSWVIVAGAVVSVSGGSILSTTDKVVINEIMYHPSDDNLNEWVELYNNGNSDISLKDWKFYDGTSHSFTLYSGTWTISPGSYTILARNPGSFTTVYGTPTNIIECSMDLDNSGEILILKDSTGDTINKLRYQSDWGGNGNGETLEKVLASGENSKENWKGSIGTGTPGTENSVSKPGIICGSVIDAFTKNGIPNAIVIASPRGPTSGLDASLESNIPGIGTRTDGNGSYTLTLTPGDYIVRAIHSEYGRGIGTAAVISNATITVNFTLKRLGQLSGTVYGTKTGILGTLSGVYVQAIVRWNGGLHYKALGTFTDGNGSYTISGLKDGTYTVVASKIEYQTTKTTVYVGASASTTCDFTLQYSGPLPDLTMATKTDIWWKPKTTRPGGTMTIFARVWNMGSVSVPLGSYTSVEFWQSNWGINQDWGQETETSLSPQSRKHFLGTATLPPIEKDGSFTVSISYRPPHYGLNNILVKIDTPIQTGGSVVENNELNNVFGRCIFVKHYGTGTTDPVEITLPVGNPLDDAEVSTITTDAGHLSGDTVNLGKGEISTLTLTLTPGNEKRKAINLKAKGERMGEIWAEVILVKAEKIQGVQNGDIATATANFGVHLGNISQAARVILNENIDEDELRGVSTSTKFNLREFLLEDGTLTSPATITIPYPATHTNPSRLRIFYLNEETNKWEMLKTTVTANQGLSAVVDHFSVFAAGEAEIGTINITAIPDQIIAMGTSSLKAIVYATDSYTITDDLYLQWSISPTDGGTITKTGTDSAEFTGTKTGVYIVKAGTGTKEGTATIVVTIGTITGLEISVAPTTITADGTATLTAIAKDDAGNTQTVIASFTVEDTKATITSGIFYPYTAGTWTITGTYTTLPAETCTVIVTPGTVARISAVKPKQVGTVTGFNFEAVLQDKNNNAVTTGIPAIYWSVMSGTGTITYLGTTSNTLNWIGTATGEVVVRATVTTTSGSTETTFTCLRVDRFIPAGGTATITYAIPDGTVTVEFIGTATIDCYIKIGTATVVSSPQGKRQAGTCVEIAAFTGTGSVISTPTSGSILVGVPYLISAGDMRLFKSSNRTDWSGLVGSVDTANKTVWGTTTSLSYFAIFGMRSAELTLNNTFCYPNPCRVYKGNRQVTFTRLTAQATIRIFNVAGEEVANFEKNNDNTTDTKVWDVPNKLSSGVYIYLIESPGVTNKVGKLGLIK